MPGQRTVWSGKSGISMIDRSGGVAWYPSLAGSAGSARLGLEARVGAGRPRRTRGTRPSQRWATARAGSVALGPWPWSGPAKTWCRPLPRALAWYIAMSASPSRSSTLVIAAVSTAMPMLAPTLTVAPATWNGADRADSRRSETVARVGRRPGCRRAARRTRRRRAGRRGRPRAGRRDRRSPTATSRSSPAAWPRPSLTVLKSSRSRNSAATGPAHGGRRGPPRPARRSGGDWPGRSAGRGRPGS